MILTETAEIKDILIRYLPDELALKIIKYKKQIMYNESRVYWKTIVPDYHLFNRLWLSCNGYHNKIIQNYLIKRINGNYENLKSEVEEIRYLKKQNKEIDIWGILF